MDLGKLKKVHFIGIGGIGISAIARMMLGEGKVVSGSDQTTSPVTEELAKLGATIFTGHEEEQITPDLDLVVYTIAVTAENPELARAQQLDIPILSYPQMLGQVSAEKFTIAVAGTHGKTTTTAMLAKIFIDAGLDPTVIVGSLLKDQKSNFIAGKSQYFIAEACEYRRSFLNLNPHILVVTNIDNDHLDYYKDLDDIKSAFAELAAKVPADGSVITEKEYSQITFDFELKVPGEHNLKNAQAAAAAARAVGISDESIIQSLNNFAGTWRRFEYKGTTQTGALVYDDYGHHPTEVRATLAGARQIAKGKIFVAFQPHLYSRTKQLFKEFAESFANADEVIILPIYAAREPADPSISADHLAEAIRTRGELAQAESFESAIEYLANRAHEGDLIITMGAGDVFKIAESLV